MTATTQTLHDTLAPHVDGGRLPGAVALVARGDRTETAVLGRTGTSDDAAPMARDTLFRVASLTKPVVAAAVMVLVDDGRLTLDDPIDRWLPELASPRVVRSPGAPLDDTVPAARPVTVHDLLTSRAGWGFPADFDLPAVKPLFSELRQAPPQPQHVPDPDTWLATLARIPLLHQPGEAWLYNTCSDLQGLLVARASGRPLPDFLAERLLDPLGMADTAFHAPAPAHQRLAAFHRPLPDGGLELLDPPDGQWSRPPRFPSGAGGLVSTADDLLAFARMLLAGGTAHERRLLSADAVRQMTTDHLTPRQRADSRLFTEGQGWGYGGSVDVAALTPYNVPGRYGWVGGTGTAAHLIPSTGTVSILLTQVAMTGPTPPAPMRDVWRYAATTGD